jgi:serine/threonine-protein kinase
LTVVLHALKNEPPPPLDLINPDAPEELVELVNHLLQKDPAHRPPTALAVVNRLKAMQAGLKRKQTAESPAKLSDSITLEEPSRDAGAAEVTQMPPSGVVPRSATGRPRDLMSKDDPTIASREVVSKGERHSAAEETTQVRTHFKTVDDSDRIRASAPITSGTHALEMPQQIWLSIAGMVGVLLGLCGFGWWLMQPPSADRLYATILQAQEEGDVESVSDPLRQFLAHHSSDPRAVEVQGIADELELAQTIRRLQIQARRAGGLERMSPAKAALLESLQLRWDQPERAKKKLESWLAVFSNSGKSEPQLRVLIKVATSVLEELQQTPTVSDDRQAELERLIAWGREHLRGEAQADFYRGIVELFSGKEWAEPYLEKFRPELPSAREASRLENR